MPAEATAPLPATVTIRASREDLERAFGAIAAIQPVAWLTDGLVCSPRAAPDLAHEALARCPFAVEMHEEIRAWPRTESRLLAGWYVRGPEHAPAPESSRELLQVPGDGFGPSWHPTTAMCLVALDRMPAAPALDAGCGSGLLSQAWARATGCNVLACDPDYAAIDHARRSAVAAGLADMVSFRRTAIEHVSAECLAGRVVLANLPAAGHYALLRRLPGAPPGVVASGIHGVDARAIRDAYRELGMRVVSGARAGRWRCWGLVAR
jgi:ribosomal protein L11 methylase PrmA